MKNSNDVVFKNETLANRFNKIFCNIADKYSRKAGKKNFWWLQI